MRRAALALAASLAIAGSLTYAGIRAHAPHELNEPGFSISEGKLLRDGHPYSGRVIGHHANGNVALRGIYRDGVKDGEQESFHFNGKLAERLHFTNGIKEGRQQGWFAEGAPRYEAFYENGMLEGKYVEWHPNGQIFRQQSFEHGKETAQKIFYENGNTYSNYVVKNDRIYGEKSSPLCRETKKDGER